MPTRVLTPLLLALFLVSSMQAQMGMRLWVLQAPDQLVEYDVATFAARTTIAIPPRIVEHPGYLSINPNGQLLFQLPQHLEVSGGGTAAGARAWLWDGQRASELPLNDRRLFLTGSGQSLFWFENEFAKVRDADGLERSVRTSARVWRTNLAGGQEETIVAIPASAACQCTTGSCSETCPEWSMWAPDGTVDEFFVMTQLVPGQLQTTYEVSRLYRRSGSQWRSTNLAPPLETIFTGSPDGGTLIAGVLDSACCGWMNESNDQTTLVRDGKRSVIYDERNRFSNANYDVSFFTTGARLAPGNLLGAHTINGDAPPDNEIRLSSDGKANGAELARVRAAIADLPIVEIVRLANGPGARATIRHAAVVGWLNDRELLVALEGHLAVVDANGNKIRDTSIRVRTAADALLR